MCIRDRYQTHTVEQSQFLHYNFPDNWLGRCEDATSDSVQRRRANNTAFFFVESKKNGFRTCTCTGRYITLRTTGIIFQMLSYLRIFPRKWETRRNKPSTPESRGQSFCLMSTFTWRVLSLPQVWGRKLQPSVTGQRYHITRDVWDYSTAVVGLRVYCVCCTVKNYTASTSDIWENLGFYGYGSIWVVGRYTCYATSNGQSIWHWF